jgi:hypothetical protein
MTEHPKMTRGPGRRSPDEAPVDRAAAEVASPGPEPEDVGGTGRHDRSDASSSPGPEPSDLDPNDTTWNSRTDASSNPGPREEDLER